MQMMKTRKTVLLSLVLACGLAPLAHADSPTTTIPDPVRFPGARNHNVTQENIDQTICVKGWTATIRPPESYTGAIKRQLVQAAGLPWNHIADYELDHLIPLELGGAPADRRNLWLQSWTGSWNAHLKDHLENRLKEMVCAHELSLKEAQEAIANNWTQAYVQYMSARATGNRLHYHVRHYRGF